MAGDRLAELMALLQGRGGGLGVEPLMGAMQTGANIQRGRFGMQPGAATMPEAAEGEAGPDTADEEMLENVRQGMGADTTSPKGTLKWESLEEDQAALESAPTDGNIQAFVDYWGEKNLPEGMGGSEAEE